MSLMKSVIRQLRYRRAGEDERIAFYKLGAVGTDVRLTGRVDFGSEPFLIRLGSHITISGDVAFVTHDGGVRVFRDRHPNLHVYAPITVGDRVFIGMGSIILPGVTIGARSVIGAGSVVTKDVAPGTVNAGVPCRMIRPIEEYEASSIKRGMDWKVGDYGDAWRAALVDRYGSA